ncbi:MAG: hypothetical protein WC008_03955 [Bacilli bacterium]
MEANSPKFLVYFDLNDNISYINDELSAVRKIVTNIIQNRYFSHSVEVQFNKEILNYDIIKEKLSDNVMVVITQVNDSLIEDMIEEIKYVLGNRKTLTIKSAHDFNKTGYSDSQLQEMYKNYLNKAEFLEFEENDKVNNFNNNYNIDNLPLLDKEDYLAFSNLFVLNVEDLNGYQLIENFNVINALYSNFHFLLRYFTLLDYDNLVTYYQKETIGILRNIRSYTSQSDDYNDNIKELLLYKHILLQLGQGVFFFDPEEGLAEIREKFEDIAARRRDVLVLELSEKIELFNSDYRIMSVGDVKSKAFSSYKIIGNSFYKHLDKLRPLINSFKEINNNVVKFNSKMVNDERIIKTLDLLLKHKIIENYKEKYGSYTIHIENYEHITFLQGKWFEFYTAKLCEEAIINYKNQGYFPDYGIYQNMVVNFGDYYRELDIVLYLNNNIFYIENKIDIKNTYRYDIDKYMNNIKHMNIEKNNSYLVCLEGEEAVYDSIKVIPITSFTKEFKKEALKILELDKQKKNEEFKSKEIAQREKLQSESLINRHKESLYLTYFSEQDKEKAKYDKIKEKYESLTSELNVTRFDRLIADVKESGIDKDIPDIFLIIDEYKSNTINNLRHQDMISQISSVNKPKSKYLANAFSIIYLNKVIESTQSMQDDARLWLLYNLHTDDFTKVLENFYLQDIPLTIGKITHYVYYFIKNCEVKEDLEFFAKKFHDIVFSYFNKLNDKISKLSINHKNEFLLKHEESDHLIAIVSAFMERFYGEVYNECIKYNDVEAFIHKIIHNNYYYSHVLKKHNPVFRDLYVNKEFFNETNCVDVANYLFLNQKFLINEAGFIESIDPNKYTFSIIRDDKSFKFLNLLTNSKLISDFREVKKANAFVGIFNDCYSYDWIVKRLWIGNYLSFKYKSNFIFTNLLLDNKYYIMFVKKYKGTDLFCLRRQIGKTNRFALIESKNLSNINDKSFVYELDKLEITCNEMFGGITNE